MADQTQPWAERTVEVPPQAGVGVPPQRDGFRRGVAPVGQPRTPRTEPFPVVEQEPTGTGWPGETAPRRPLSWHLARLRRGGEWSAAGGLFAFVCWGVWALSGRGDLSGPLLVLVLSLLVAVGLFALARVVGRLVLERQLGPGPAQRPGRSPGDRGLPRRPRGGLASADRVGRLGLELGHLELTPGTPGRVGQRRPPVRPVAAHRDTGRSPPGRAAAYPAGHGSSVAGWCVRRPGLPDPRVVSGRRRAPRRRPGARRPGRPGPRRRVRRRPARDQKLAKCRPDWSAGGRLGGGVVAGHPAQPSTVVGQSRCMCSSRQCADRHLPREVIGKGCVRPFGRFGRHHSSTRNQRGDCR